MGTRSLTLISDSNGKEILVMYRQYDGYPSGLGLELAQFLEPYTITNGISDTSTQTANGMGCLAAQMVKHFKECVGNIYLYPASTRNVGEEFTYAISVTEGELRITIREVVWVHDEHDEYRKIFEGTPTEMIAFCEENK
ncbi:MAG: hypothetical protein DRQ46_04855 [Gammaproteobacteria bacterium]|nr:MAG: hypothetical protein DRQ46_04855 [Gammaproteobacteria bacterium]